MTKEFIPYEQALALKELGFDEPCFGLYHSDKTFYPTQCKSHEQYHGQICSAPLYQQAFRWFREKYNLQVYIDFYHKDSYFYKIKSQVGKRISNTTEDVILQGTSVFPRTYEEAELACLIKLIEIVKND
jgi:hypothetical protein